MSEEAVMWVEKYRPKMLDEVVDHKSVIESLKGFLKSPNTMPHLLFAGPPGNGKTSVALCLARQLLGPGWRNYVLELNASDERGIQMVRERIKNFTRHVLGTMAKVPFGLVILDESDQMTAEAQTALRRIMEANSRTSRFILICNYSGKIIEPIQSRCAIFRFAPLARGDVENYLRFIAKKEKLNLQDSGVEALIEHCGGDLRRAVNTLQAAATVGRTVDRKTVLQVMGKAGSEEIRDMLGKALKGDFLEARNTLYTLMATYGMSGSDIIRQVHREIFNLKLPPKAQIELADIIGEYDFRLVEGANDDIQLSALLAQLVKYGSQLGEKA
ncbi:replication factor C small subunit [Candidatus Hecatella orcuttiae]|jgi:replication factor C small subunit|uniref:replication factor C small subunit n=1 Tax=Candidatus Hecatella orcuttiae TaxID=1935119 RepID=UPI002868227F|nr:replication factor C small subunit [Candidatus Hecatella orcuttiae]